MWLSDGPWASSPESPASLKRDDPSASYVVQSDLQQSTEIPRQVPNEVHVMGAGRYDSFDSGAVLHEKSALEEAPSHLDARTNSHPVDYL